MEEDSSPLLVVESSDELILVRRERTGDKADEDGDLTILSGEWPATNNVDTKCLFLFPKALVCILTRTASGGVIQ